MMPAWLELPLTLITIYATLFFLVWAIARDKLSYRARLLGWTAIALVLASVLWSLMYESLLPYLRTGRIRAATLTLLNFIAVLVGAGLTLYGTIRFLKGWWTFFLKEYPRRLDEIRSRPAAGERWSLVGSLIVEVITLPGLGLTLLGLGVIIGANNALEVGLAPNRTLIALGGGLALLGGWMAWRSAHRGDRA